MEHCNGFQKSCSPNDANGKRHLRKSASKAKCAAVATNLKVAKTRQPFKGPFRLIVCTWNDLRPKMCTDRGTKR